MKARILRATVQLPAWLRIQRFKLRQAIQGSLIFLLMVLKDRGPILLVTVVAVLGTLYLDRLLFPMLSQTVGKTLFDDLNFTQETLAAIIAGLSVLLGLLVTLYVFAFQLSSERFEASDRMLDFFRRERISNNVLNFLTFSIVFSLVTLFSVGIQSFVPYLSTVFSIGLGVFSVVLIVTYFRRTIGLTQPGFIFQNIAGEVSICLNQLKKIEHEPSIEDYLRRQVADQVDLFKEFITVFVDKAPSEDRSPESRDRAAGEGMTSLLVILDAYAAMKRFIPTRSYWFPRRKIPMPADGTYPRHQYIMRADLEAIGQLQETEIDVTWLERQLLDFTGRIVKQAAEADLSRLLAVIPFVSSNIMLTSLRNQEFDILELVLTKTVFPYLAMISDTRQALAAEEMYGAVWNLWLALLKEDDSDHLLRSLPSIDWLDQREMRLLDLPALFRRDVLSLGDKLQVEILVEGRRITPDSELVRYCQRASVTEVKHRRRSLLELIHARLSDRITRAIESEDTAQAANTMHLQLRQVRQVLLAGDFDVFNALLGPTLNNCTAILPLLVRSQDQYPEAVQGLENEAFHYLINMIHLRCQDQFKSTVGIFLKTYVASRAKTGLQTQDYGHEKVIVLGSLALLYSEFDQGIEPFGSVLDAYEQRLNLAALADLLELYLKDWHLTNPWITRYHAYFTPIQRQISALPERAYERPGRISELVVPDHPSVVIQKLGKIYFRPPMEAGAYHLYIRVCERIGREPAQEVGRRYG